MQNKIKNVAQVLRPKTALKTTTNTPKKRNGFGFGSFVGIALLVFAFFTASALSGSIDENLIALLFVRRDNIQKNLRGEVFPIARYSNGKYEDASIMAFESQRTNEMLKRSILNRLKDFFVYHDGRPIGSMKIKKLDWGMFQCLQAVVGSGDLKLNIKPDFSQGTSASVMSRDGEISYLLVWYPASAKRFSSNFSFATGSSYEEKTLIDLARKEFLRYGVTAPADLKPKDVKFLDLDLDRVPEVAARFEVPLKGESAHLLIFSRLRPGNAAELLLSLFSKEMEGSWGKGYTFIDVIDANDDGVAEVLVRYGGWEIVEFLIFELKKNTLTQVFRGAQYGC